MWLCVEGMKQMSNCQLGKLNFKGALSSSQFQFKQMMDHQTSQKNMFASLINWSTSWFIPKKQTDSNRKLELEAIIETDAQNQIDFTQTAREFIKKIYHPSSVELLRYLQRYCFSF